jgi:hypothetical protein
MGFFISTYLWYIYCQKPIMQDVLEVGQVMNHLDSAIEVQYDDASHRYSCGGHTYTSATQLISQFKPPFDTEERSQYMAHRYGNTAQYWKDKWARKRDSSCNHGNQLHDDQEQALYRKKFVEFNPFPLPVLKPTTGKPYITLPDGVYPEMKLWRHDWAIAGRSDKVILHSWGYVDPVRIADVEDYKTNEKMHMYGWQNSDGTTRKMLEPISHIEDAEYWHHALQLSEYQYMLEYFGFYPGKRRIIHFPHEIEGLGTPAPVIYELPYLRREVLAMLEHNRQKQLKEWPGTKHQ